MLEMFNSTNRISACQTKSVFYQKSEKMSVFVSMLGSF